MSILIFGGSGFIGTRLSSTLHHSNSSFIIADKITSKVFSDKTLLLDVRKDFSHIKFSEPIDVIINLAAEHKDNVRPLSLYHDVNITGAINICNFARSNNINKIIFTSSVAVYGFASPNTDESGKISPFNEYGRSKFEAELVYQKWQSEDPSNRTLVIIRPTVIFGEGNRGNVFTLFKQIYRGRFFMVGNGLNRKSIAYVDNIAHFIVFSIKFNPGVHTFNYVDDPSLTMNELVCHIKNLLGLRSRIQFRIPFFIALIIGYIFDFLSKFTGKDFPISAIRVIKFCSNSTYASSIKSTGFIPPVSLTRAIEKTILFEFNRSKNNNT